MHKRLCRGHVGSVWLVWLIGCVGIHGIIHAYVRTSTCVTDVFTVRVDDTHEPSTTHESGMCLGIIQPTWDRVKTLFTAVHRDVPKYL